MSAQGNRLGGGDCPTFPRDLILMQGRNAVEIPRFEAMVPASEAKIAKLRVPVAHNYQLVRQQDK